MHREMTYKLCKFLENIGSHTPLLVVYISFFSNIVRNFTFGGPIPLS